MNTYIVMTQDDLKSLMEEAVTTALRRFVQDDNAFLNGTDEIVSFLGVSQRTFYRNLEKGMYGTAVMRQGKGYVADRRKLVDEIARYNAGIA